MNPPPKRPNGLRIWSYSTNIFIILGSLVSIPLALISFDLLTVLGGLIFGAAGVWDIFNCHTLYEELAERSATKNVIDQRINRMMLSQAIILGLSVIYFAFKFFVGENIDQMASGTPELTEILKSPEGQKLSSTISMVIKIVYLGLIAIVTIGQSSLLYAYQRNRQKLTKFIQTQNETQRN